MIPGLRDVHTPVVAHAWWPLAPGWYVLFAVCLNAICLSILFAMRWRKKRMLFYAAQFQLKNILTQYNTTQNAAEAISAISLLLRQVALAKFSAQTVAGLHGEAWLQFLEQVSGLAFQQGPGALLVKEAYQLNVQVDVKPLYQLAEAWIKKVAS